jgi:putative protein-disulfide isomerase
VQPVEPCNLSRADVFWRIHAGVSFCRAYKLDVMTTLHYLYDPLCGWCYGSSPLVKAACDVKGLSLQLHGGGMMAGAARQLVSSSLREFIAGHEERVTALTGQPFGKPYSEGLMRDPATMLDSEPPTTAILAVQAAIGDGLQMLSRIQNAHYLEGRRVAERAVLTELAADVGLQKADFDEHFTRMTGSVVQAHIAESRRLLARVGGQGFPTFVLESGGRLEVLQSSRWFGQVEGWRAALETRVAHTA